MLLVNFYLKLSVNYVKWVIEDQQICQWGYTCKYLKECNFTFSVFAGCINQSYEPSPFPDCLQKPNATPIF